MASLSWAYSYQAHTLTNNAWLRTCMDKGSNSFVQLWDCAVTQQMVEDWISLSPQIPMVCQAYQAVPALISQLAIVEAPMSLHPGHSGLNRGQAEFKGYSPQTVVILPMGVYFPPRRSMFQSWRIFEGLFVLQDWNTDCGWNKHPAGVLKKHCSSGWTTESKVFVCFILIEIEMLHVSPD